MRPALPAHCASGARGAAYPNHFTLTKHMFETYATKWSNHNLKPFRSPMPTPLKEHWIRPVQIARACAIVPSPAPITHHEKVVGGATLLLLLSPGSAHPLWRKYRPSRVKGMGPECAADRPITVAAHAVAAVVAGPYLC